MNLVPIESAAFLKCVCDFLLVRHCDYGLSAAPELDSTLIKKLTDDKRSVVSFSTAQSVPFRSGPILHRFWDKGTYWLKIAYFSYPSLFGALTPYIPLGISRSS